jgi:hypothetical protein
MPGMEERRPSAPIVTGEDHAAPSIFEPANLLSEARRQKRLPFAPATRHPVAAAAPRGIGRQPLRRGPRDVQIHKDVSATGTTVSSQETDVSDL